MKCPECRAIIDDSAGTCRRCGAVLSRVGQKKPAKAQTLNDAFTLNEFDTDIAESGIEAEAQPETASPLQRRTPSTRPPADKPLTEQAAPGPELPLPETPQALNKQNIQDETVPPVSVTVPAADCNARSAQELKQKSAPLPSCTVTAPTTLSFDIGSEESTSASSEGVPADAQPKSCEHGVQPVQDNKTPSAETASKKIAFRSIALGFAAVIILSVFALWTRTATRQQLTDVPESVRPEAMHVPVKKRLPQRMAALPPTGKKSPPQKEPACLQPALKKSPETFTAAPPDILPAQNIQLVTSIPEQAPEQGPARVAPTSTQELLPYFTIQVDSFRNKILAEQHRLALLRNG
ncbi:MAG: hypothetical protein GY868_09865, partial [Deltaproteobacteria bacterium]|nr:hypothetical protein [Deltaproteobacteria bacterium]